MNKVIPKIVKTSKILLLLAAILTLQHVNVKNSNERLMNENLNKTIDLTAMAVKLNEIQLADKFYPLDTFSGDLTGYGADCSAKGCTGVLSCKALNVSTGKKEYINALRDKVTTYTDKDYGSVRIVASSKNLPCGTIITFESKKISKDPVLAIVLDRGVLGTDIDLLTESEDYARDNVGRTRFTYDVLRFGWERE